MAQIKGDWCDPDSSLVICQRDAYQRTLSTKVLSCNPVEPAPETGKKKSKQPKKLEYGVILEHTILYPEGGGQPTDHGSINGVPVKRVEHNTAGQAVHFVESAMEAGVAAEVELDWTRRYDHMQQHTGQHVLSAVAEELKAAPTVSWELSARYVCVDLGVKGLSSEDLERMEVRANEAIRGNKKVWLRTVNPADAATFESPLLRGKLPTDGKRAVIRLVEIEDLDVNACGGTHVHSTAELQLLKVAKTETDRGNFRVYFLVGDRALAFMGSSLTREAAITAATTLAPPDHAAGIQKLVTDRKDATKRIKTLSDELAQLLGRSLVERAAAGEVVFSHHRPDGSVQFLQTMADAALELLPSALLFLSTDDGSPPPKKGEGGEAPGKEGSFLIAGPPDAVKAVGAQAAEAVGGRGGGKPGRLQGKATHLERVEVAMGIMQEAMKGGGSGARQAAGNSGAGIVDQVLSIDQLCLG